MIPMPYTFTPKQSHARAYSLLSISTKSANVICRVIRKKPLKRSKRLLEDLISERRSLSGKYYTKAVAEILKLLESCEKNAVQINLDSSRLMVHASAHTGPMIKRRRRKAKFGSRLKRTNVEIMLIEQGKEKKEKKTKKEIDQEIKEEGKIKGKVG